jgi:gliding motility-associated-like protein
MVVSFTDNSSGSPSAWDWDFGNGVTSTVQNPTTAYLTPGFYTVKLKVTNASGSNTMTKTNYINVKTPPTVSLSATPLTVCPGVAVSFTSSVTWNGGTGTYQWDFGDGGGASTGSATHAYSAGGSYTVKLTATNGVGCPTTDTQLNLITVHNKPAVNFTASDTAVCALGGTTTFTSTTTGTGPFSYTWDYGDGSPFGTSNPTTHAYYVLNMYSVKLIATDANGCTDSLKRVNYIRVRNVVAAGNVPSSACQGSTVTATSASGTTSGAAISWDFGDGTPWPTGATVTHNYSSSGTFVVRMFATVGGCTDTDSHTITINPRPNPNFSFSPAKPCPSPVTVTFTAASSGASVYNWDFGDGFTGSGYSTSHTYTQDTDFVVKLVVVSSAGCSSNTTDTVHVIGVVKRILDPAIMNFGKGGIFEGCFPYTASMQAFLGLPLSPSPTSYPYPITSSTWNFGDGSATSTATNPVHTYSNYGTYTCSVIVTTSNGCTFYDTTIVHVGGPANLNFYATPNPACAGSMVYFFDSSVGQYGPMTAWQWDFGDTVNYGVGNPTFNIYKKPGIYTVTMLASQNGCWDTLKKVNYVVVKDPASIPKFTVDCSTPGLVHFKDSSIGATSILWYFGDGTTSTVNNPNHTYATTGVYIGSLVAWNSSTGCKDSTPFAVIINNPTINLTANDSSICAGDTLYLSPTFTGLGTAPGGTIIAEYWNWNQGSTMPVCCNFKASKGSMFIAGPPNIFGNPRGQWNVTYAMADNNGCVFSKTIANFLTVGGPIAHFKTTPMAGCAPAVVTFTDTSKYAAGTTPTSIFWDFGDGTTATTPFPAINHNYPSTGSYGISIKVKDNIGCTDSLGIPNYLLISRPTAIFGTLGTAACAGTPYTFFSSSSSSTGGSITHSWDFGDGGTSTQASPSHVYVNPGSYTVRLIVTDANGCKDTMTKAAGVTVAPKPTAGFTMDDTINVCPPLIVNFTNTSSGAASYNWNFGNSITSTLTNATTTYTSPGVYNIRLIATNSYGCNDTAWGRARVLGYKGVLSYSPLKGCAPLTVQFQANNVPGVVGFIYDFGDGTNQPSTATTITHVYTQAGPHVPRVTMTDNLGCSTVSVGLDTIKVDGVIAGFTFTPFPACDKGTIQFIDTSKGSYSTLNPVVWQFHDGTVTTQKNPSKTYPGPGRYPVIQYGSTTTGCKDTFRRDVVFHPLPSIFAGLDTTICVTDSAIMKPRGGISYLWSPGASLSCTNCTNPYAFPTVQTTYTVIGTDTNGCTNKDTVTVNVKYKTVTDVKGGGEICSGDTVQFFAGGASVYQWTPPYGLSDPHSAEPFAYPMVDQHYTLISRLAGCIPDTDYVNLTVHPTPTVEAGASQTMIAGNTVHLEAVTTGIITKYLWTPTEGIWDPLSPSTDAAPKRTTIYKITVTTEFGCTATDTVRVVVLCDNSQVYLPNTFTPDGNGVNDVFYPRGRGIANIDHFRIYDRWGEVVFERNNIAVDDKNNGWDGKKGGRALSPDIFVYTVEATCDTGEPIKWQGDVMLLR